MSMLAEPRRRSKYSVDPRGLNWSQDEDKFGQKMLEKMGWSKGKGLGANENGRAEHVKVSVKVDQRGVGCSKSYADNWIAHQDDFNSLLSNLNQVNNSNKSGSVDDNSKNQVISLEKKSKSSKGRVHYMKFTKGKDLSSRKNEELDCIFGRRKSKSAPSSPQTVSKTNSPASSDTENEKPNSEIEKKSGVITITNSLSVSDYFAKKMKEIKAKRAEIRLNSENKNVNDEETESELNGKVGLGLRKCATEPSNLSFSSQEMLAPYNDTVQEETNCVVVSEEVGEKRKKKKKKEKRIDEKTKIVENKTVTFNIGEENGIVKGEELEQTKKKKNREKDINGATENMERNEITIDSNSNNNEKSEQPKKKRRKDKKVDVNVSETSEMKVIDVEKHNIDSACNSKKRKRENNVNGSCIVDNDDVKSVEQSAEIKKKKKWKRNVQLDSVQNDSTPNDILSVPSQSNEDKTNSATIKDKECKRKKRLKKVKNISDPKSVQCSVTIVTEVEPETASEKTSKVTAAISCETKKRKKPNKDAQKLVQQLIVSTSDSNVKSENSENQSQVENDKSSDKRKVKKTRSKRKKKKLKQVNGLLTIDSENVKSNLDVKKMEVGFKGSNLGQVVGYAGGVALPKNKSKK